MYVCAVHKINYNEFNTILKVDCRYLYTNNSKTSQFEIRKKVVKLD